jgi:HTH-type transcriptional regulator, sugar sensing transcriptional regulator
MDAESALVALGFSVYESRAYVALLAAGSANGYEIAKRSGVPRANVYDVLDRLAKRKAVVRRPGGGRGLYVATSPDQLAALLTSDHAASVRQATTMLAKIGAPPDAHSFWEIDSYDELIAASRAALASARERLAVALYPHEAAAIGEEAERALRRGTDVLSLCMASCARPCGGCAGTIYRRNTPVINDEARTLVIVSDDRQTITARIGEERTAAILTAQPAIVQLARDFVLAAVEGSTILPAL